MKKLTFGITLMLSMIFFSNLLGVEKNKVNTLLETEEEEEGFSENIKLTAHSSGFLKVRTVSDVEFGNYDELTETTKFTTIEVKDGTFEEGQSSLVKIEIIDPEESLLKSEKEDISIPVKVSFVDLETGNEIKQLELRSKEFHSLNLAATIEEYDKLMKAPTGKYSGTFIVRVLYEN